MIKQMRMGEKGGVGEFGFTETLKHFCSQNSRNSDRSKGLQLQPSFTVEVRFVCHFSLKP